MCRTGSLKSMNPLDAMRDAAAEYQSLLQQSLVYCHEKTCNGFSGDEHILQLVWQAQAFEGAALTLVDGTPIEVVDPGRWNHADGPDFCDAVLVIGGTIQRGAIEVHVRPTDWDAHRHTPNPAYGGLILHVTWFATPGAKTLPPRVPHLALERILPSYAAMVETVRDSDARYAGVPRPCRAYFQREPLALDRLLAAAGYHRLLIKTERFIAQAEAEATSQVFYEGLMVVMGYRRNSETFRRLAQEVPLRMLEPFSTLKRFAVLARISGLLKEEQRDLWDLWWESGLQPPVQPYHWDLKGMRPQNHPLKRLAGGLGVLHHLARLLETPVADLPKAITQAGDCLRKELHASTALIGSQRAVAVMLNLFIPYRLALGTLEARHLSALPGETLSMPMRDTWQRLTGRTAGIPTDGLRQQGLLQIYADFCHNPKLLCDTCPLANRGYMGPPKA